MGRQEKRKLLPAWKAVEANRCTKSLSALENLERARKELGENAKPEQILIIEEEVEKTKKAINEHLS